MFDVPRFTERSAELPAKPPRSPEKSISAADLFQIRGANKNQEAA